MHQQLRKIAFKVINSSTLILPTWRETLKELKMKDRIIPRDVETRWNSTYDMLGFALEYRRAIDILTANRNNDLRSYELSEREWIIASQLCDILKVCDVSIPRNADSPVSRSLELRWIGLERRDFVLLAFDTQSCYGHSCYGFHQ
jgi:hypothetical protein